MLLLELFGTSNPKKLINKLEKMFADWKGHRDKNEYFHMVQKEFEELKSRYNKGEDVTKELKALKKEITSHVNMIEPK